MDVAKTNQPLIALRLPASPFSFADGAKVSTKGAAAIDVEQAQPLPPTPQPQPAGELQEVDTESLTQSLSQTIQEINSRIAETKQPFVRFTLDSDLGSVVVKVVDPNTDEIIRQIPPEEILSLRKRLAEMRGILIDKEG